MTQYLVGIGSDASTFATPDPQPRSPTIRPNRRTIAADLTVFEDGTPHAEWRWDFLTTSQLATLYTQMGLSGGTPSALVTIQTRDEDNTFVLRNATAVRPETEKDKRWDRGKWRNVIFRFLDLTETA
jgi:hypothetical protein